MMWKTSVVWAEGQYYYKRQILTHAENEWYALHTLRDTGFVPKAERLEPNLIRMAALSPFNKVNDWTLFQQNCLELLRTLYDHDIRHGDLTRPHVFVFNNSPVIIDFAESRLHGDPRADKRPEGDRYWLTKTVEEMMNE